MALYAVVCVINNEKTLCFNGRKPFLDSNKEKAREHANYLKGVNGLDYDYVVATVTLGTTKGVSKDIYTTSPEKVPEKKTRVRKTAEKKETKSVATEPKTRKRNDGHPF